MSGLLTAAVIVLVAAGAGEASADRVPPGAVPPGAVPPGALTGAGLQDAVEMGGVATLAQLCGLRDEAWAFDLRRAMILDKTQASGPDDPALREAAGSALVVGALSFADVEATEHFAEAAPEASCGPLRGDAALGRADAAVAHLRALKSLIKPGS